MLADAVDELLGQLFSVDVDVYPNVVCVFVCARFGESVFAGH